MSTIGISELPADLDHVLKRVKEDGETIEVADGGQVIALIVPSPLPLTPEEIAVRDARDREALARWRELGAQISAVWPEDVSAVEAIRDERR